MINMLPGEYYNNGRITFLAWQMDSCQNIEETLLDCNCGSRDRFLAPMSIVHLWLLPLHSRVWASLTRRCWALFNTPGLSAWKIRPPILTVSKSGMLAELAFSVPNFSKSKLSAYSEAGPRGFVFPLPFPFCVFPRGMAAWEPEKLATLMCACFLLSSVQVLGLAQGILPS